MVGKWDSQVPFAMGTVIESVRRRPPAGREGESGSGLGGGGEGRRGRWRLGWAGWRRRGRRGGGHAIKAEGEQEHKQPSRAPETRSGARVEGTAGPDRARQGA